MGRFKKFIFLLIILLVVFLYHSFALDFSNYFYKYNTGRINKSLILNVSDYHKKEFNTGGAKLTMYYKDSDTEYMGFIERIIMIYYPVLAKTFELDNNAVLTVIIYPDLKSMNEALNLRSNEFVTGCYYGGVLNILSPAAFMNHGAEIDILDLYLSDGPLIHELTHLAIDKKTNGNCPLFFSEGVALYFENKFTGFNLSGNNDFVPVNDLMNHFRELNVSASYARSFEIVKAISDIGGEAKIISIIDGLSRGLSFQEAFENEFGLDFMFIDKM